MGALKDLVDILTSLGGANLRERQDERRRLFEIAVRPAVTMLREIHADYFKTFTYLLRSLEKRDVPRLELVHWLRERAAEYSGERVRLQIFDGSHEAASRFLRRSGFLDNDRDDIVDAYLAFGKAIEQYVWTGVNLTRDSWFSSAIDSLEDWIRSGQELIERRGWDLTAEDLVKLQEGVHPNKQLSRIFERTTTFDFYRYSPDAELKPEAIRWILEELPKRLADVERAYARLDALCNYST